MDGLFVIDSKKGSFAFRLSSEGRKDENVSTDYPDFLKAVGGLTLVLYRPDGVDRVARAFQQHEYNRSVSTEATIGNLTYACTHPGQETFLRGHAYVTEDTRNVVVPSPTLTLLTLELKREGLTVTSQSVEQGLCGNVVKEVPQGTWYHPVYHVPNTMSLPGSMVDALDLLKLVPDTYPGITKLKEIVAAHSHLIQDTSSDPTPLEPFVVVEGMDATGKSTLVGNLCRELGAIELCSPPPIMAEIRPLFDSKYPALVRRMYYSLGNYILGLQVAGMRREKPVVMDRYWHSTAAYSIASECIHGDDSVLPPPGHWAYQWPDNLHCPSMVIYLTVSEQTRIDRLKQRQQATSIATTAEEKWLGQDENLRKRIAASYQRMGGCKVTEVDASGTKENVLQKTIDILTKEEII